jgi:hypothetical protein
MKRCRLPETGSMKTDLPVMVFEGFFFSPERVGINIAALSMVTNLHH